MTQVASQALQKVGKGTTEKISLRTTAENSQGRCRRDAAWQFVPDTGSGDRKSRLL